MAVSILNQWPGSWGTLDAEYVLNPTPGNTLVAVLGYHVVDGSAPLLTLGDVSRNAWTLLADPFRFASSAHAGAQLCVEVWACPSARYDGWPWLLAYAAATQFTVLDVGSGVANIFEIPALSGELTVDSVTLATATSSTTAAVTVPAPTGAANCLMVAAAISDIATAATPSGTGWAGLTSATTTAPNVALSAAWREATTGGTVTFTGSSANWAAIAVAIRTTGTTITQPNPTWPATRFEVGLGYDMSTPLPRVRWTRQTSRYLGVDTTRGVQAERGVAQQGQATPVLSNNDGAYTPRTAGTATATATGTTTTIKVADASAANIHISDFFRLKTSGGALKELNVFQVTALSSTGGTTTITFTRADGTSGGAQAATASGDVYAGIAIDLYIPWRLVKYVAGTPYIVGSGRMADLQIDYLDAHRSTVTGAGVDELETLATVANPSALRGELTRHSGLYAYWPLDDATGSGYAANQSGTSNAPLVETVSKFGAGGATADFGAATQGVEVSSGNTANLLGDAGSGWSQDGQSSSDMNNQKGYALLGADPGFPSLSSGVTIMGAILETSTQLTTIANSTTDPTVVILRNGDPGAGVSAGSIIKLSYSHTTYRATVTVWDKDTHAATSTTASASQLARSGWNTWALVIDRTSWALYLGGAAEGTGSADLVASFTGIEVGGEASPWFHGKAAPGTHAHIAVYGRKLTAGEIASISTLGLLGRSLDPSTGANTLDTGPGRVIRKLGAAGWRGTRVINPDGGAYSAEDTPTGSIFDIVSEVLGYQDGLAFIDAAGQLQGRTPGRAYYQSSRATLGDGPGEIPYQPGQAYGYNRVTLWNEVTVANTTGYFDDLDTTTLVAVDDTSSARYSTRSLPVSTRWSSNAPAYHLGWWLLGQYAYPSLRVQTVTVSAKASGDTASSAGRWAFVCGVEVGDLVTINRRPIQTGQPLVSLRCIVLQVTTSLRHADTGVTADVTLTLAAAPPEVAVTGTTTGALTGTVLGL